MIFSCKLIIKYSVLSQSFKNHTNKIIAAISKCKANKIFKKFLSM